MARHYTLGTLVLFLFTATLAFGATATGTPPAASPSVAAPTNASDGFQKTVEYFQKCVKKATEIEGILRTLHEQAAAAAPADAAKQLALFQQKLNERYPGATYNGKAGTVEFQKNFFVHFTGTLNVEKITEAGAVTVDYLVTQRQIYLTYSKSAVTIMVDQADPSRSTFVNVTIPTMKDQAEKIVIDPDRKRIATDTAESAVMNDAYQLLSLTSNVRMDVFAVKVLSTIAAQEEIVQIAVKGYRDRHQKDYAAPDPSQKNKKKVDTKPNKPADKRFYEGFLKLVGLIAALVVIVLLVFKGIRALKVLTMSNVQQRHENQYHSLSPMVMKALHKLGRSLWGINLPWAKHYYIYLRNDRWILCDGKEDKAKKLFLARTRIEVCLRSTYFKLKVTRLNGVSANIWLHCTDLSWRNLIKGLEELSLELTNPTGRDDGVDSKERETVKPPAAPAPAHSEAPSGPISAPEPTAAANRDNSDTAELMSEQPLPPMTPVVPAPDCPAAMAAQPETTATAEETEPDESGEEPEAEQIPKRPPPKKSMMYPLRRIRRK